jgi:hypothetical protein
MIDFASIGLPSVTLCCVDTDQYVLSSIAIRQSQKHICFARTLILTDQPDQFDSQWETRPIAKIENYRMLNDVMLKQMRHYIETDFVLNIQYDGFVVNAQAWTDEFLQYDYIGAPWPHMKPPYQVGNGGFSLRSRKLLMALEDNAIQPSDKMPEDLDICLTHRAMLEARYGIRFAPVRLAQMFSCESQNADAPLPPHTFGFHGMGWLTMFYERPEDSLMLVEKLASYALRGTTVLGLLASLATNGRPHAADLLIGRIAHEINFETYTQNCSAANLPAIETALVMDLWQRKAAKQP